MLAVKTEQLNKTFNNKLKAVNDLSLQIKDGEIFGLLGPNGAGKTTLINMLVGKVARTGGNVEIFGYDPEKHPSKTKHLIGVVPQEIGFDSFLTVKETLTFHAGYFGLNKKQAPITQVAKSLSLDDKLNAYVSDLSGGMKRRLLVAQAMIHSPKLLILDEPTAGVDVELRQNLWSLVRDLNNKGTTVILTTHYLEEAEAMCDRVAIINHGSVVAQGSPFELKSKFGQMEKTIIFPNPNNMPSSFPHEFNVSKQNGKIIAKVKNTFLPEFFVWLKQQNINLENIQIQEESLEQVFVRLIDK